MKRMKHTTWIALMVIITISMLSILIDNCEGRGGRGRGGGSFGGIFGGWRKYKKPTTNHNSRRTINGSPMHTTATKSVNSGAPYSSLDSMKQSKPPAASYPKQQTSSYGGYPGAPGSPPLPQGSTYYPNMGAMPPGALYYPQPMRSSSGTGGDFLMGMMAGHLTSNLLFGPRHHVTHIYHQNPEQTSQTQPKVIIVNNGEMNNLNETEQPSTSSPAAAAYWPTDTDTPLEPYNESVTPADALQAGKTSIFQRNNFNNFQNAQTIQGAASNPTTSASPMPPVNGIICMPFLLNETNPNDPTKIQQVERVICFPAPPPPPPPSTQSDTANSNCAIRTFVETDPNDPSKTIEVPKQICTTQTTTSEPRQVAGEIGETNESSSFLENEQNEKAKDTDQMALDESSRAAAKETFNKDDAAVNATDPTADNKE